MSSSCLASWIDITGATSSIYCFIDYHSKSLLKILFLWTEIHSLRWCICVRWWCLALCSPARYPRASWPAEKRGLVCGVVISRLTLRRIWSRKGRPAGHWLPHSSGVLERIPTVPGLRRLGVIGLLLFYLGHSEGGAWGSDDNESWLPHGIHEAIQAFEWIFYGLRCLLGARIGYFHTLGRNHAVGITLIICRLIFELVHLCLELEAVA